ncbi:hypothetical protein L226DRAFT_342442 [Lentinus tigrinus ALCF2SS1-7]|uniref:uncharacterized protein n=1 Tax=Lentinus tigrinus ALCF2SS1-7 TaxID=1328758 RepID=UPI00116634AA|nr:hypothetical protein L226DRAFT_342442 [Lentinus tigrinus ALCF2SS1-7]
MLFAAVLPLPFRPRASGSTIPVGPPPSLFCTTTAVVSNTNTHHGRRSSNRSIFPFLRSQPRISVAQTVPQPAACATGEDSEHCREPAPALFARGRSKSDVEAGRTQNAQDEGVAVPPQTCSRARSLPNIFSTVYLPCLSKANAPSSPTSFQGSRSRESSPVIVNRHSREPEDDGDESADPVLPRSVRPVSEDPWDALEEVAAFVRGLDSPTSPSSRRDLSFGTPSPKTRPHQIPEVELLPPLSPLWRDTEGCPKTLSACSAEELTNPGSSWQYRREDIVPEVASSVEEKVCVAACIRIGILKYRSSVRLPEAPAWGPRSCIRRARGLLGLHSIMECECLHRDWMLEHTFR